MMKRFYQKAETIPVPAGHAVALDGRPVKTPAKRDLALPSAALAQAIAAEWDSQQDEIRPQAMPLMSLACRTLDRMPGERERIVRQVADYAATDLVCYRAAHPAELAARQQAVWQPLVDWAMLRYDAPLEIATGVIPKPQPASSLRAFAAAVGGQDDYLLTALHMATAACGSLIIGLALLEGRIDADAAFAASQLDESFQIEAWGEDAEQAARRRALAGDIASAAEFMALARA